MIPLVALWVLGAMLIGFLGRNYRFGFWGYFFASVLLSPVIGLLMLLAAVPRKPPRGQKCHPKPGAQPARSRSAEAQTRRSPGAGAI